MTVLPWWIANKIDPEAMYDSRLCDQREEAVTLTLVHCI